MPKYTLTENEKNILRIIYDGIKTGEVEKTWVVSSRSRFFVVGGGQRIHKEIEENRFQMPEFRDLMNEGFISHSSNDAYVLHEPRIAEAVECNFADEQVQNSVGNCQHIIFICYSHKDELITHEVADLLHTGYENVWFDRSKQQKLSGGQEWKNEIRKQISRCNVFVFMMSPASLESDYCQEELLQAKQEGKYILPVCIAECQLIKGFMWLGDLQWVDMKSGININTLSSLYGDLIRATPGSRFVLTPETVKWAKDFIQFWNEKKIDQSFTVTETPIMNSPVKQTGYGYGIFDDQLRTNGPFPPVAVLIELADNGLIRLEKDIRQHGFVNWNVILLEKLRQAVKTDFR